MIFRANRLTRLAGAIIVNLTDFFGFLFQPNAVKLPLHFGKAIKHLLQNSSEFTPLKDLPLSEESDKLELATTLWTEKLISVQ